MALTECPECHHIAAVHRERLGHRAKCPNCATTFRSERLPFSLGRMSRSGHPAGLWAGILLLLGAIVVGVIAGMAAETTGANPLLVNGSAVAGLVGVALLIRHALELSRRPVPVGRRQP
jgi:hypothetical protein